MTWWITVVAWIVFYLYLSMRHNPQTGLAIVVPSCVLFPAWFLLPLFENSTSIVATGLDVKVAVGTSCLILYCFLPGRNFPVGIVPSDWAMLGLVLVHVVSDFLHDGWSFLPLGRAYAEWYMPYVAGRVALQNVNIIERAWRPIAIVAILLTLSAIVEGVFRWNVFEYFFGMRPIEGAGREYTRWGLKRAYGPTLNPIYFGVLQILYSGWLILAAGLLWSNHRNWGRTLALAFVLVGAVCCGSRGPVLATVVLGLCLIFFSQPRSRPWLSAAAAFVLAISIFAAEPTLNLLEKWVGEDQRVSNVNIHGETRKVTNLRARLLLLEVNKIAFKRSGLLGFGTSAVTGFPINVPLGHVEAEAMKKIRTIDNTYALILLRFGYLGLLCFSAAAILSCWQYFKLANKFRDELLGLFCCAFGAVTCACLFAQLAVWMPHEIGMPLVWTFGVSAGLTYGYRSSCVAS